MFAYLSVADSDNALELTPNQTTVCLGDNYYLFCISQEPFGDMCTVSSVDWFHGANRIAFYGTTFMKDVINTTVQVLWFPITENKFREPQTFKCTANNCKSNRVSVGKFGESNKPGTHMTHDW